MDASGLTTVVGGNRQDGAKVEQMMVPLLYIVTIQLPKYGIN